MAIFLIIIFFWAQESKAQLNPLSSIYYQNQYLANPAMAGLEQGLALNLGYRKQWSGISGSPQSQSFTGDWGFNNRVGVGLALYNDKAGLLQRTRAMGTYAYHLPMDSENTRLNFGISLGFMTDYIDIQDINGESGDVSVGEFNQRRTFIDGDFGVAYTSGSLNVQGAIPNLKTYFKKDENENTVDRSLFFTAISYKFHLQSSGLKIEPKIAYRGVKGHDSILDVGTNLSIIDDKLSFMGIWHSSQSTTFGMGMNYKKVLTFIGMYTTETGALSGYSNGDFEMAVKINLFREP